MWNWRPLLFVAAKDTPQLGLKAGQVVAHDATTGRIWTAEQVIAGGPGKAFEAFYAWAKGRGVNVVFPHEERDRNIEAPIYPGRPLPMPAFRARARRAARQMEREVLRQASTLRAAGLVR